MLVESGKSRKNSLTFKSCSWQTISARRLGGCIFAENPDLPAADALVAWCDRLDPSCAKITAARTQKGELAFWLDRALACASVVVDQVGIEHVIIGDAASRVALDVVSGSLLDGPAIIGVRLDNAHYAVRQLRTVQNLFRHHSGVQSAKPISRRCKSNDRIVAALRVADARNAGASHRDVAIALFGTERVGTDWNATSDSMRSKIRRLVGLADTYAAGGWRRLLL
jgi:hypothetical protein